MAILRFHVVPNAKGDRVVGERAMVSPSHSGHGGTIRIKLRAPAVEGKANAALRRFLAEELNVPQRAIVLEHGERSRDKVIRIDGLSEEDVRGRLLGPT
jgi:uncharacterized protein